MKPELKGDACTFRSISAYFKRLSVTRYSMMLGDWLNTAAVVVVRLQPARTAEAA